MIHDLAQDAVFECSFCAARWHAPNRFGFPAVQGVVWGTLCDRCEQAMIEDAPGRYPLQQEEEER